jgi:hypothetical protein
VGSLTSHIVHDVALLCKRTDAPQAADAKPFTGSGDDGNATIPVPNLVTTTASTATTRTAAAAPQSAYAPRRDTATMIQYAITGTATINNGCQNTKNNGVAKHTGSATFPRHDPGRPANAKAAGSASPM